MRTPLSSWVPPVLWMAVIFALSHQPDIPRAPGPWLDFLLKKALHAAGYAILALLWRRPLAAAEVRRPGTWAFVIAVAYAATDEWHQTFVPGRTGRTRDVLIDAVGAIMALAWAGRRDARR